MWRLLIILLLVTSCFKKASENDLGLDVLKLNEKSKSFYDEELLGEIEVVHANIAKNGKFSEQDMDFIADVYSRPVPDKVASNKRPDAKLLGSMYLGTRDIRFLQLLFTFAINEPKDKNAINGLADVYSAFPKVFIELLAGLGDNEKETIMTNTAKGIGLKYKGKLTIENAKFFVVQGSLDVYEPTYQTSSLAISTLAKVQKKTSIILDP